MIFDDDLIQEVQDAAPPGVHYEEHEVVAALEKALDDLRWGWRDPYASAIRMAAGETLRRRMPAPEPPVPPRRWWHRFSWLTEWE